MAFASASGTSEIACSIVVSIKLFPVSPRSFVRGHAPSGESKEVKVVKGARELEEEELELENPRQL